MPTTGGDVVTWPNVDPRCAACLAVAPCWRWLRIAATHDLFPDSAVPEGGFGDHIDGHVPLCGACLLKCPDCDDPVLPPATRALIADLERVGAANGDPDALVVSWFIDPCTDPTHGRPAQPSQPPRPRPVPTGPTRHTPIPHELWVADEWRGLKVGDEVRVPRPAPHQRGTVFEIFSHRLGGGVVCTIVFPDATWVSRRASDVVRLNVIDTAQAPPPGAEG